MRDRFVCLQMHTPPSFPHRLESWYSSFSGSHLWFPKYAHTLVFIFHHVQVGVGKIEKRGGFFAQVQNSTPFGNISPLYGGYVYIHTHGAGWMCDGVCGQRKTYLRICPFLFLRLACLLAFPTRTARAAFPLLCADAQAKSGPPGLASWAGQGTVCFTRLRSYDWTTTRLSGGTPRAKSTPSHLF